MKAALSRLFPLLLGFWLLAPPARAQNTLAGNLTVQQTVKLTGDLTPAQITADQNDYAPTGHATAAILRLSSDASRTLTGLAGGAEGRVVLLLNVGAQALVLANESASSTAANRFALGSAQTLGAGDGALLFYDAVSSRWRLGARTAPAGAGSGTVTSLTAGNLAPLFTTAVADASTTPALTFALSNASANTLLAGPTSGAAAAPAYRSLVAADIPSLTLAKISDAGTMAAASAANYSTTSTLNAWFADPSTNGSFAASAWRADLLVPPFESVDPGAADIFPKWDDTLNQVDWLPASNFRTALGVRIGVDVQAWDADLTTWSGISPSANVQTMLGSADNAAIRTNIGLAAIAASGSASDLAGGTVPDARFPATLPAVSGANLTALNATALTAGTVANALLDAELQALAGLTSAADKLPYFTGAGTAATADFTAAGRALLDDASASNQRTTLGLVIGTDVQAYDAALAALAAGSDFVQFTGPTTSTKVFTLPDASSTLLYSGGPLGTPSSGTLTNATGLPTAGLVDDAVTFAKLQNIATDRLLGRDTALTGDPEEITVGGGLEFTGTGGIQRSALTGAITASAGSGSTALGSFTLAALNTALSDADVATGGGTATGTNTGDQTITLTGDVTGSGTGSFAATLATVNSNVGTFGSATQASVVTVNAKGLVTAASNATVTPAVGSITGLGTGVPTALAANANATGGFLTHGGTTGVHTFANTGLKAYDTNASHALNLKWNSDDTADRTLNLVLTADRTLTINGNPTLNDWFDQSVKSGATPTFTATNFTGASGITGTGALNSGSITSGFGAIDIGTDTLAAGNTTITGALVATGQATLATDSLVSASAANANFALDSVGGSGRQWVLSSRTDGTFKVRDATGGTDIVSVATTGVSVTGNLTGTGVYSTTTGSAANVFVDSNGLLQRSTSSLRYKRDVRDYQRGLADVMKLRPILYKGMAKGDGETDFAGLIAEEVHEAGLTEFVVYNDVLHPTETEEVEVDGKTVTRPKVVQAKAPDALAYANMVTLAFKAIQELKAENDALRARIDALEAK